MKLFLFVFIAVLCCEFSEENLQGPPAETKKEKNNEDDDFTSSVEEEEDDKTVSLKIVSAPDLSQDREKRKGDNNADEISETEIFVIKQAKFLQKVVQEIDGLKYQIVTRSTPEEEEEELPPAPKHVDEKILSPEEEKAKSIYQSAMTLLNKTKPNKLEAYIYLKDAAFGGNPDAKALIAWAQLFGNPLPQNLEAAKEIFEELAGNGYAAGHMGLGFLYATGLAVNVSQSKALVHYTMGALGGNTWAQMVLGYRYWSGITVASSCERALNFYRLVADTGNFTTST